MVTASGVAANGGVYFLGGGLGREWNFLEESGLAFCWLRPSRKKSPHVSVSTNSITVNVVYSLCFLWLFEAACGMRL